MLHYSTTLVVNWVGANADTMLTDWNTKWYAYKPNVTQLKAVAPDIKLSSAYVYQDREKVITLLLI